MTGHGKLVRAGAAHNRRQLVQSGAVGLAGLVAATCGPLSGPGVQRAAPTGPTGRVQVLFWDTEPLIGARRRGLELMQQRYPSISLDIASTAASGDVYYDKLNTMFAADTAPDVFIIADNRLPEFIDRKLAYDVNPLVKRDKYDLSDFPKAAIDWYTHKGGLYGLPDNITSIGFFVNVELFRKVGLEPPPVDANDRRWTYEAFVDRMRTLKSRYQQADPPVWGILPNYAPIGIWPWVRGNGADFFNKDRTGTGLDAPGAVEALQMLADLRHKYRVAPTPEDMQGTNARTLLASGRLGIWDACVCQVGWARENLKQFEWDAGWRPFGKATRVDHLYAFPLLIYRSTKNPEGAWTVLKWFEDEAMKLIAKEGHLQGTKVKGHLEQYFADPAQPPKHVKIYNESVLKWGRVPPATLNWAEVERQLVQEFAPLFDGKRTAQDTVAAIKATVDPLVLKGRLA